jgi:hypothetical protein
VERRRDLLFRQVVLHLLTRLREHQLGIQARGSLGPYSWVEFQLRPPADQPSVAERRLVLYHFPTQRRLAACLYWRGRGTTTRRTRSWIYPAEARAGLGPYTLGRAIQRWVDSALALAWC